jgi:hypothetical protein
MSTTPPSRMPDLIANPSAHFDLPGEIVTRPDLSDTQKKKILDAWEEDARRLAVATEEGMAGGEPSRIAEVAAAKAELGLEDDRKSSPTKSG